MLKAINLKKFVFETLVLLIIFIAYEYQKPILTTGEATDNALLCLAFPPERLGIKAVDIIYYDITLEKLSIDKKSGFFNKFTNQRELSVTLKTKNGEEPTVRINAYNGRCLEVTNPIN
ncbi:hypothetical protein BACCIP111895_03112 [Neobacillus rhizosphaerae]|uniref:Uncharacterized protein n=1 Tax=Neobacillus rhizosphaerae TaxID=2880965 RepID=A0ABN8KU50_9BACI|nr:hypothetical protein [Neobacillus rhizosphaerae]CAH2715928.1 hypothetical protein BACCIP111895_03112 [Neobacillus rhizosphaerae]